MQKRALTKVTSTNIEIGHVTGGAEHAFCLSTTGELYSWGLNFKGQLGHDDFDNRCKPTLIKNLSPSFLESGQLDIALKEM
mmetsp:Transcript_640/g.743  ORF Transcript_640/g.743 Transcript_640/m.743 type:complete len:81 (-) Transcript_640:1581-1823(-)